jgi:hypothetical protein
MIRQLIPLQHGGGNPALRAGMFCLVMGAAGVAAYNLQAHRPSSGIVPVMESQALFILALLARPTQRASHFEASLPVAGRQIALARILSSLAVIWGVALCCAIYLVAWNGINGESLLQIAATAAIFTFVTLLPQTTRPRQMAISCWRVAALWAPTAFCGALAWWLMPPAATLAIFALASAAAFARIWTSAPLSYQAAPREASAYHPATLNERQPGIPWWPVIRSIGWQALGFAPSVVVSARMDVWGVACPFALFAYLSNRQRMRWLDSLPLSHRKRLLLNLLPAVGLITGATALGIYFGANTYPVAIGDAAFLPDGRQGTADVQVHLEYWKRAPGGIAPMIESPWGESFQPKVYSPLGYSLYNPYSAGPANTKRFFDWQFGRATEAVYGHPITPRNFNASRKAGLLPSTERPAIRFLNLAAFTFLSLLLILVGEGCQSYRIRQLARPTKWIIGTALIGPPVIALTDLFLRSIGGNQNVISQLIQRVLLSAAALLPENLAAVVAAAALPVLAVYWLLERQFAKSEIPGPMRVANSWRAEA